MKRLALLVSLLFSVCACASGSKPYTPPKLPYHSWYIGLAAPRHMEVWVETVDVLDNRGGAYFEVHRGRASYARTPEKWPLAGRMMPVNNVDLPQRIFLRWQSLVEPQAYKIRIPIPQWVRDEMLKPERVFCQGSKKWKVDYRDSITLGMAPGGIVKVWMDGACLDSKEVGRFQAEIEPLGPFRGKSKGQYIRIEPENKAYVEQHGIPYGTW
ncbi:DUF2931 family protein [Pseudomonas sp. PCH199]|uniref:DUF2931 family protein n=1 Tax=unclassified Pseudomonas TaxID=196821 RepID=UPI000BC82B71|nr:MULTISPECIES: DUF2931 family protein [unclassified Pseudomonas]MCW8278230.1 DUF2931 family protein [Pseudomonas sp. PCH199]PAM81596.1 hypothetical protein CES87_24335 [Pseudomonas sp. ERMR1:02]